MNRMKTIKYMVIKYLKFKIDLICLKKRKNEFRIQEINRNEKEQFNKTQNQYLLISFCYDNNI